MVASGTKSVTKTKLSAFVRTHTGMNVAQSKELTDRLLAEYSVIPLVAPELLDIHIAVGQDWLHRDTQRVVRVTHVQKAPQHVLNSPMTSWAPVSVSWAEPGAPRSTGTVEIDLWREHMELIVPAEAPEPADESAETDAVGFPVATEPLSAAEYTDLILNPVESDVP
jgi:hypothetical protein